MYFVTFWCGKCQAGSVALDVHAQRVLKYNFILINDFTIIETSGFNVFL
jgi:hypothetical protein